MSTGDSVGGLVCGTTMGGAHTCGEPCREFASDRCLAGGAHARKLACCWLRQPLPRQCWSVLASACLVCWYRQKHRAFRVVVFAEQRETCCSGTGAIVALGFGKGECGVELAQSCYTCLQGQQHQQQTTRSKAFPFSMRTPPTIQLHSCIVEQQRLHCQQVGASSIALQQLPRKLRFLGGSLVARGNIPVQSTYVGQQGGLLVDDALRAGGNGLQQPLLNSGRSGAKVAIVHLREQVPVQLAGGL